MTRKNKKRRGRSNHRQRKKLKETSSNDESAKSSSRTFTTNPLLQLQRDFISSLPSSHRDNFFSCDAIKATLRAKLWMKQADLGEECVNQYSWSTPDERAIRILKHFSPIIEIGCGANAYWCKQMKNAGIDVVGYDIHPIRGGLITSAELPLSSLGDSRSKDLVVQKGGPEVLRKKENAARTLFLCYPDEDFHTDEANTRSSLGLGCLENYDGEHIIHVGELFLDTNLSIEMSPWGRSSGAEFQVRLATEYHCLLKVSLPNWLHTRDTLSVWKRSETCTMVFAADEGDDADDVNEEVKYRHVPVEDRLPTDVVAPCLKHLLDGQADTGSEGRNGPTNVGKTSTQAKTSTQEKTFTRATGYSCPW